MKDKKNILGINKQLSSSSTTKLAMALKRTLMVLTLCIISTLCIQAEESTTEPSDSIAVTGPKKSHWKTEEEINLGWGITIPYTEYHNEIDYAQVIATIQVFNGTEDITSTVRNVGNVIITPSREIEKNSPFDEGSKSAYIYWNCGIQGSNNNKEKLEAAHKLTIELKVTDEKDDNYVFDRWEKKIEIVDTPLDPSINPKSTTINDNVVIGGGGTVPGTGYGSYEEGTHNIKTYGDDDRYTVTYIAKFVPRQTECNVTFDKARGGGEYTYKNGDGTATTVTTETEEQVVPLNGTTATILTASTSEDYKFWAWYVSYDEGETYDILSNTTPYTCTFEKDAIVYAQFIPSDAALFIIKDGDGTEYWNLNEACTKAQSSSNVVLPKANGTLYPLVDGKLCTSIPIGRTVENYTIPSGVTLWIPHSDNSEPKGKNVEKVLDLDFIAANCKVYRFLTLSEGVTIIAKGNIEVSALQVSKQQSSTPKVGNNGAIYQGYGEIIMQKGSKINLQSGAYLYAWGRVTGSDESLIKAYKGAVVYESFQITDYQGGSRTKAMYSDRGTYKIFPFSQYYIQNIETPLRFEFGAKEYANAILTTGALIGDGVTAAPMNELPIIGNGGSLFNINSENSYVEKRYDAVNDRQVYKIGGTTSVDDFSTKIKIVMDLDIETKDYLLPFTNNIVAHIESGELTINANLIMNADNKVTVDSKAKVRIAEGKSLFVYDKDDWKTGFVFASSPNTAVAPLCYTIPYATTTGKPATVSGDKLKFTANPPIRTTVEDATLQVDGELIVNGNLYVSPGLANICSTGAGKVTFPNGNTCSETYTVHHLNAIEGNMLSAKITSTYTTLFIPAQLHNDETKNPNYHYTQTSGAAVGDEFWYVKSLGKWVKNEPLDIVDADNTNNKTLTINANGWASSGWPYTINDTKYGKDNQSETEKYRQPDRTLVITYSGEPNADMPIVVKNASNEIVSRHIYKVPFVYTGTENMNAMNENSIVFVKSGTLSIEGDASAKEIYVAPGAELKVTGKLTVGKLVLRTTPWQSAVLTNSGTINGQVYYSRIAPNKSTIKDLQNTEIEYNSARYYQFGLPLSCSISSVTMSNTGKFGESNTPYGNTWLLKSYNESKRAKNGISSSGDNWEALESTGIITAGVGYEIFSNSNYYREFYFPVDLSTDTTTVNVSYTSDGTAGSAHAGWNIVCSPLIGNATVSIGTDPATAIKPCWLLADGSYTQEIPEIIPPAVPFAYQTSTEGTLNFVVSTAAAAPRRQSATEALTETEWVHLDIFDAYGEGDETSIFVHPTRFEQTYKTGIDVAKQSLTAARPIIYSTHAYGDMAFAGIADSLLENGIDLVVYSPSAQELTFSLRENKFLHRLEYLWLADNKTGARTNLLMDDYTCRADAGTAKGRFVLNGRFKAPQIATGIDNTQTDYNIYAIGNNIAISGVEQGTPIYVFDAVGHMIYTTSATSDEVIVPAPCAGVYMLSVGGQTAKLVINQ